MQRFLLRLSETEGPGHSDWPSLTAAINLLYAELEKCWMLCYSGEPLSAEILTPLTILILPILEKPLREKLLTALNRLPNAVWSDKLGFGLTNLFGAISVQEQENIPQKEFEKLQPVIHHFFARNQMKLFFIREALVLLKIHYLALLSEKIENLNKRVHVFLFSKTYKTLSGEFARIAKIKEYVVDRLLPNTPDLELILQKTLVTLDLLTSFEKKDLTYRECLPQINERRPILEKKFLPASLSVIDSISSYLPTFTRTLSRYQEAEEKLFDNFKSLLNDTAFRQKLP